VTLRDAQIDKALDNHPSTVYHSDSKTRGMALGGALRHGEECNAVSCRAILGFWEKRRQGISTQVSE
jgi:hypothetical protein